MTVAPSLVIVCLPFSSTMSRSPPYGPSVPLIVACTARQALMFDITWPRPCDWSVPETVSDVCIKKCRGTYPPATPQWSVFDRRTTCCLIREIQRLGPRLWKLWIQIKLVVCCEGHGELCAAVCGDQTNASHEFSQSPEHDPLPSRRTVRKFPDFCWQPSLGILQSFHALYHSYVVAYPRSSQPKHLSSTHSNDQFRAA